MDLPVSEEKEREIMHDIFHEHPLRRIPKRPDVATDDDYRWQNWCYGCWRFFLPGEAAYGCCTDNCDFEFCLHEECAEMPKEIRHHVHPQHTLTLQYLIKVDLVKRSTCAVCDETVGYGLGYICSRDQECKVWIHLGCAVDGDLQLHNRSVTKKKHHPSHPQHELMFLGGKKRSSSFECDACGTMEKGNSYSCAICDYCIHESCAELPISVPFNHHHHHLSLAFHLPRNSIKYEDECAICKGALRMRRWVYHCHLCSYVVHIKCAINNKTSITDENAVDEKEIIIKGPINDIYEEMIKPLVERSSSSENSSEHKFLHHHHPLSFIEFSDDNEEEEEEVELEDDIGNIIIPRSSLAICEGCTLPIIHHKSSSTTTDRGYMSCGECNYSLHLACFNLPPELPSLPLHSIKDHKLELRKSNKMIRNWSRCRVCSRYTNGLIYACTKCSFGVDIKCASLPSTMKHEGHPQHNHYLKLAYMSSFCRACYYLTDPKKGSYRCNSCHFSVCCQCVLLPRSNRHRMEKHELPLTYNARVDHPGEFYCASCEDKMWNPRSWMYHCRDCDQSFHPHCFPATSGRYRNINFGRKQYYVKNVSTTYHQPHHPLRFQSVTKKKRCDLSHEDAYDKPGFQCEACNFAMCLRPCGETAHRSGSLQQLIDKKSHLITIVVAIYYIYIIF